MAKKPKFTNGDDNVNLGGGDDTANAKGGNDVVSGGSGNDKNNGGAGNDFLRGGTGDDRLNGGEGDDRLAGGAGDDTLLGGKGTNIIDGGEGDDLVILDGNFADAKITADGTGYKIVTANGTTTVTNVESFQFEDGVKGANELLPGAGKTFTLTTAIDNIVGTSGDDIVAGAFDGAGTSTLNTGDLIDGGDGKDTLLATLTSGTTLIPSMKNVETLQFTNTAASNVSLVSSTGITSFNSVASTNKASFSGVAALAGVSLKNTTTTAAGVELKYNASVVAGLTDTQTIALENNGAKGAAIDGIFVDGVEKFAVTATGVNVLDTTSFTGDKLTAITVAGAGSLTAGTSATITSFDASTATGAQSFTFGGTSDVVVKGGAADDSFSFGTTFTSKDTVDAGAGTKDNVSLEVGAAPTADVLAGINAFKGVEQLTFTGTNAGLDHSKLTNAEIKTFTFDTSGADTVTGAAAAFTYNFSATGGGSAAFTMKAGETVLNLGFIGDPTAGAGSDDADITTLDVTGALQVNISSTGLKTGSVNDIGVVTNTANATVTITGDANTTIGGSTAHAAGFGASVILDASKLTGTFDANGSASADTIRGSLGGGNIEGWDGIDNIFLNSSKVDLVDLSTYTKTTVAGNQDVVFGFTAGAGGDHLVLNVNSTDNAGGKVFNETAVLGSPVPAATDIFEFNVNFSGTTLDSDATGAALLALTGPVTVANDWDGFLVAYQAGNAYVYAVDNTGTTLASNEIALVATLKGVALGALTTDNFDLI